jgi:hypothetical protein
MPLKMDGVNDAFVVDEAIAFAVEGMSRLPSPYRPERKIAELKSILHENSQAEFTNLEKDARRSVNILLSACRHSDTS